MPVLALLFLWAGLFIQIPIISAQEPDSGPLPEVQDQPQAPDPVERIRAYEQTLTFDENAPGPAAAGGGPSTWSMIRMVLILALAAAAVYGVVFFIKKASKRTDAKDPFLKILAAAHLGSNRYVHIAAVGSRAWLLGSSDGGVNLISEIEDKDILNAMLLDESQKSAEEAAGRFIDFKSILRRFGMPSAPGAPAADNIRKRRDRLKGL